MSVGSVEDDASTAQQSALHEVKRLITENPSFLVDPISPTLLITSKRKGNTYFIGADAVLYKMNDRTRVRPQLQSTLNDEIDWVETYNQMASILDSKKESSARARLPSTDDEKRAALEKLYQSNIKRSQSEALAQLDNNRKATLAQWGPPKRELDDSAVSDIDRSPKRPNLMLMSRSKPPIVAMIESRGDSKRQLKNIYARNPWLVRYYLPPTVVKNKERIQLTNYCFTTSLDIRRTAGSQPNMTRDPQLTEAEIKKLGVNWGMTFEDVIYYLYSVVEYYQESPGKVSEQNFTRNLSEVKSTLTEYGFSLERDEPMQLGDLEMKPISGRGLTGAGYVDKKLTDKDGNPIKYHSNRGYNLSQLEGTGMYSAMAYKRVGTKFIHLPKLNENLLKVVYPNRSTVGSQRKLSAGLTDLIKELVFDSNINQARYESLPMDDRRVFHELLRITHTQHALRDPLKDPRDVLKQEYIKLKGELMLGNNNPAMIKELKRVLIDMYSAKLIDDDEFKEILMAIV